MQPARRVVGEKDVHGRKAGHEPRYLRLVIQECPAWLIPPRTIEAAKVYTLIRIHTQVQIVNRRRERAGHVVVTLHSIDTLAAIGDRRLQDYGIRYIPAGKQDIGLAAAEGPAIILDVGYQ